MTRDDDRIQTSVTAMFEGVGQVGLESSQLESSALVGISDLPVGSLSQYLDLSFKGYHPIKLDFICQTSQD